MASKVAGLVRNFLQTDGDALYLVAGEKIFVTRGTTRAVAGREIVSDELFRAVVDELVPGVPAATLAQKRSRLPYVAGAGLPAVEIHFAIVGGAPALMIVRPGKGPGGEALRTPTPAPLPPEVLVAPPSIIDPGALPSALPVPEGPGRAPSSPRPGKTPPVLAPLLALARERGASDLVFSPGERPLFRIHGSLVPAGPAPPGSSEAEEFLAREAPPHVARALARTGGARFALEVAGAGRCLFRASRDRSGTVLSARPLADEAPRLEDLGLPDALARLAGPSPGLLLVAGPPGSGRTTVLAAVAAHAAQGRGERVVTLEDPVEIGIPHGRGCVSQREAGTDVPSIRAGLRAALSEDADVVFAGAIPDAASAALVVELAASGRLVLAPAPAPSLTLALQWLDAMLPEGRRVELRSLLAATFRGGLALALCRGRKGGRALAAESLHPGSLVSELILSGGLAILPDHLHDSSGYVSLNASLGALVARDLVEPREALLRSLDRSALLARLREDGVMLPPELSSGSPTGPHVP